jgi:hypothetical protein
MIIYIKKYIRNKFLKIGFNETLKIKKKFITINNFSKHDVGKFSFGNNNRDKIFYVIKRTPGGGFFSNLGYVIKNLDIANKKNYIPIVDMFNFPTMYNQKKNMNNKKNVWEIFFKQTSNYKLKDVYKSKNVYFSPNNLKFRFEVYKDIKFKKIFDKYVSINKKLLKETDIFCKKNFKKKKILGIHFRGTDQKISPNHAIPPTIFEIKKLIDQKIKYQNFDKIFLLTEQQEYYDELKRTYGNLICAYDFFRSDDVHDFSYNSRKNHRNKLGIENLIEAITLSKCKEIIYCESNISLFSIFYSNFKIKKHHLNKGVKGSNPILAFLNWHFLNYWPQFIKNFLKI